MANGFKEAWGGYILNQLLSALLKCRLTAPVGIKVPIEVSSNAITVLPRGTILPPHSVLV